MLKRRAEQISGQPVQMDGVKDVEMRMMVGRADGAPNFSMRHFTVQPGGHTPHHQHNYEHEVVILEGAGEAQYGDDKHAIRAGDVLFIEPNTMHQFRNTGSSALKFICLVPGSFDCGADGMKPVPGS